MIQKRQESDTRTLVVMHTDTVRCFLSFEKCFQALILNSHKKSHYIHILHCLYIQVIDITLPCMSTLSLHDHEHTLKIIQLRQQFI